MGISEWKLQAVIMFAEIGCGFIFGRFLMPLFRKLKTGKFEIYIGDRFRKDGSEPKFGGVLIFMTFLLGMSVGVSFSEDISFRQTAAAVMFCGIILAVGIYEDMQRETARGIGLKPAYRITAEFAASAAFLVLLDMFGYRVREVLLPFRMGYIDLGAAYIPLTALLMTLIINIMEKHDCLNGVTDTGTDGLCMISAFICTAGLTGGLTAAGGHSTAQLICVCAAGSFAAMIIWCCSPSKMYPGQSGSLLTGAVICCIMVFTGLHIAVLLALLAPVIDGICAVIQRIVYRRSKKLLFKGASLHEHLKNIGWGDYKIMCADISVQVIGCIGAAVFIFYESRIVI